MAVPPPSNSSLTPEHSNRDSLPAGELDEAMLSIARQVCDRGLSVPAVFFLEMNKPLTGIVHASAMVAGPSLKLLFGAQKAAVIEALLSSRENIERLIQLIEQQANPPAEPEKR